MAMLELLRGMRPGLTVHGLRSSFRDWCADNGKPGDVAEAALAHSSHKTKVQAAYERTDHLDARWEPMAAWAAYCLGVVEPKSYRLRLAGRPSGLGLSRPR